MPASKSHLPCSICGIKPRAYNGSYCQQCHIKRYGEYRKANQTRYNSQNQLRRKREKANHPLREVLSVYGLTPENYLEMFAKQDGVCYLCLNPPTKGKWLDVDHNHITGKPRKLLCRKCNVGIGLLQDDVKFLDKAIKYLNEHN